MFILFDLPVKTKEQVRTYTQFRSNIMKEGFIMIQYSVYCRFCRNDSEYSKYVRRIKAIAPKSGEIRLYSVTETQYNKMHLISTKKKSDEELLSIHPLVVIED